MNCSSLEDMGNGMLACEKPCWYSLEIALKLNVSYTTKIRAMAMGKLFIVQKRNSKFIAGKLQDSKSKVKNGWLPFKECGNSYSASESLRWYR